jgi:hypothetical protein
MPARTRHLPRGAKGGTQQRHTRPTPGCRQSVSDLRRLRATGRGFYACPGRADKKCNFFKWADEKPKASAAAAAAAKADSPSRPPAADKVTQQKSSGEEGPQNANCTLRGCHLTRVQPLLKGPRKVELDKQAEDFLKAQKIAIYANCELFKTCGHCPLSCHGVLSRSLANSPSPLPQR